MGGVEGVGGREFEWVGVMLMEVWMWFEERDWKLKKVFSVLSSQEIQLARLRKKREEDETEATTTRFATGSSSNDQTKSSCREKRYNNKDVQSVIMRMLRTEAVVVFFWLVELELVLPLPFFSLLPLSPPPLLLKLRHRLRHLNLDPLPSSKSLLPVVC